MDRQSGRLLWRRPDGVSTLRFELLLVAAWAGQEASLLLWGWLIAAMGVLAIVINWKRRDAEQAVSTATLALICGFFAALMLFAANPFTKVDQVPVDGQGLNPMLQDRPFCFWGMRDLRFRLR